MKKRLWLWFLVCTIPFVLLTLWVSPLLGLGLVGFFSLYALLAWRRTGYTNRFMVFKEAIKDSQPLAELMLAGLLVLLLLLAAYRTPGEAFLVLIALVPLLAAMAFPDDGAKAFAAKGKKE
ncbi:hypothetical protein HY994_05550 [Candidatus Micrarchaeota archaeon]|nr:hypothetical protein [Candidatus Micrarchaeota archaeon]